jgi:hypothetical protein
MGFETASGWRSALVPVGSGFSQALAGFGSQSPRFGQEGGRPRSPASNHCHREEMRGELAVQIVRCPRFKDIARTKIEIGP